MCPPPCGPRRSSRAYYHIPSEKITKSEVDEILDYEKYSCDFCTPTEPTEQEYEGCLNNLHLILHDGKTRVRVVGSRSQYYRTGFRTIVMTAPCFPATFIIRIEN